MILYADSVRALSKHTRSKTVFLTNLVLDVFQLQSRVAEKKSQPAKKPAANSNAAAKKADSRTIEGKALKVVVLYFNQFTGISDLNPSSKYCCECFEHVYFLAVLNIHNRDAKWQLQLL